MGNYRDFRVWKSAHNLALDVYRTTLAFPRHETFGLVGQMRRCAVSVAANLAEGSGRDSDGELARYGRIAMGSACELDCYVLLARELAYLDEDQAASLLEKVEATRRMPGRLCQRLGTPRKGAGRIRD